MITVGTALLTVTLIVPLAVPKFAASFGRNTTACGAVPALGARFGFAKTKLPAVEADPPVSVALASVCPYVITEASGGAKIDGAAGPTATFTDVVVGR